MYNICKRLGKYSKIDIAHYSSYITNNKTDKTTNKSIISLDLLGNL
jgi:hypothetical protein